MAVLRLGDVAPNIAGEFYFLTQQIIRPFAQQS